MPRRARPPRWCRTLAGAEFTVKYYDGFYAQDNLPEKATRTWVLKTDEDGFTGLSSARENPDIVFKFGDFSSYQTADGKMYTLPLGTVTIQETKAPAGLPPSDGTVHLQQITSNTSSEFVSTFVEPSEDTPPRASR